MYTLAKLLYSESQSTLKETSDHTCVRSPPAQKICVIFTPRENSMGHVSPVLPYNGGVFDVDAKLCERSGYLPKGYIFSVCVYTNQYLHVRRECFQGTCNCIYYLDCVSTVLKPCQFAVAMYKHKMWSEKDLFVLGGVCKGVIDERLSTSIQNEKLQLHTS